MPDPDPREIVRRGYDALSYRYRADQAGEGGYAGWLRPGGWLLATTGQDAWTGGHALFWARRPLAGGGGGTGR